MSKQIIVLLVLLVLLIAGVFVYQQRTHISGTLEPQIDTKFLDLAPQTLDLNSLQSIYISRANEVLANAQFVNGKWYDFQFESSTGFPLQEAQLSTLVRQLQRAQVLEQKSGDPKNHVKLGLLSNAGSAGGEGHATRLSIVGDNSVDVLVGNNAKIQKGQFVRFDNSNETFLVDQSFNLPQDNIDWLRDEFLSLVKADIINVSAFNQNALIWQIQQDIDTQNESLEDLTLNQLGGPTKFELLSLSEEETLAYESVLNNYIESLVELRFLSVTYSPFSEEGLASAQMRLRIEIIDAQAQHQNAQAQNKTETIELAFFQEDEKFYLQVLAAHQRAYLNAWRFEIPQFQAENLLNTKEDFLRQEQAE